MWPVTLLVVSLLGFGQKPQPIPFASGLGTYRRGVTGNALSQRYFNQGLAYMYGFHHGAAIRSFEAAVVADPHCGMAYWGIACANGPNINDPITPARATLAEAEILKVSPFLSGLTEVERDLIGAQSARYTADPNAERGKLDTAYADSMRKLWAKYPQDADVGALFAEALMDLRPWDQWLADGTPQPGTLEVVDTLDRVLKVNPMHPLGLHLTIHAWEASKHPERALGAANALRTLEPGLGHMVHMPSHIDVRLGHWREAILSNERGIAMDDAQMKRLPRPGIYSGYMAHNRHMLAFAGSMIGQRRKTLLAVDGIRNVFNPDYLKEKAQVFDWMLSMPLEMRVRFGMWKEILAAPKFSAEFPVSEAMRRGARAIAYSALRQTAAARRELQAFDVDAKAIDPGSEFGGSKTSEILSIQRNVVEGEILLAEDRPAEAIVRLKAGVAGEDALHYGEPPDWIVPVRHALGAAYFRAGQFDEAVAVYLADLDIHPHNGWALFGLWKSYAALGNTREASETQKLFEAAWAGADFTISSSCLCLPLNGK